MAQDGTIKIKTTLDNSEAESAMSKFSGAAKTALKGVEVAVGTVSAAMAALAGYAVNVGSDFESGMSKVSAISGATGDDLEALSEKAKEMGAETKFSATEAASAFEYMAMAGWKTEDMLNGIEGIMNLAAASGEDLATTSDIVTDALTAFGMSASDSTHFADVLAQASSNANTNVSMMGETFKYVAPVAGSLGFSVEDCAVAIGLMANSGIKASQAGTSLRQIFTNLVKPTDAMQGAMDKLGISLTDSAGNTKSLDTLMGDLRNSFAGLTDAEKAQYAATLAGQEGMSGFLAIVNASDADFNALKNSINNADGAAKKMAGTMQDNLQGSLTIMKSAMEGFGIKIYEEMQEPLRQAADTGTEYINRLSDAFESGGIHGVVEEAGEIFEDLTDEIASTSDAADGLITPVKNIVDVIADLGGGAVTTAVKTMQTLAENTDKVIPLAVSAYTAFKVYTTTMKSATTAQKASAAATELLNKLEKKNALQQTAVNGSLTIRQTLMAVNNGQITVATAATGLWTKAQAKLNATLSANPIGLVVTAIAALTAGVTAYAIVTKDATEKAYGLNEEQKKAVDACEKNTDKLNEQRAAREEAVQSIDKEYDGYEILLDELRSITDENGKVKEGYEGRAAVITGQLSDALGVEVELLDGQIQKYGEVVTAIENVIVQKKAEATLSAMQEDMANAYADTEEAINKYKEASKVAAEKTAELEAAQEEAAAAQERFDNSFGSSPEIVEQLSEESEKAEEKVRILTESQKEAADAAQDSKEAMAELSEELNNYNALQEAVASGDTAKISDALENLVTSYREYTGEALAASEETRSALYSQAQGYVENLELIQDSTLPIADEIYAQMAGAAAKTIENFNQLPGGIAQGIEEIGPEASAAMLSALAQADLDGKLDEEGQKSVESLLAAFNGLDEKTAEKFSLAAYGALSGLEGFGENLVDPAEKGVEAFLNSLRTALDEHSPSKKTEEIFQLAMEGAEEGIDGGKDGVLEKAGSFVNEFLGKFSESGLKDKLQELGSEAMSFFGTGVSSRTEDSRLAGKANADAANSGAASVDPSATGSSFGGLFGGGIGGTKNALFGQGKSLADNAKSGADSVNPNSTGGKFGAQYASGVGSKTREANRKGKSLADNAKSGAGSADSYSVGSNFGSGFVNGISSWISSAASAAANLASSAYNAAKRWLDEHSPSKKSRKLGSWFSQGFGLGISGEEKFVDESATQIAQTAIDALDADRISDAISSIDVPETMARINAAIDDKHFQVSERVIAATAEKERVSVSAQNTADKLEIDYKRLGRELSKRPIVVSNVMDSREFSRLTAVPMEQRMKQNSKLKNMLNGGSPR